MKQSLKQLTRLSFLLLPLLSTQVHAAGYAMEFQSASVLGDAGEAAVVEDAGTNWYNSAGLVYVPRQLVVSAMDLYAPTKFTGTATAPSRYFSALGYNYTASGTASSYPNALLPAVHFSLPLNNRWALGISTAPAWGLAEDYGWGSFVRYDLTRLYTKSIDVSPSVAYKLNDQWSFGLGPDFNYFYISSRSAVNTNGPTAFGGTASDSLVRYSADDWHTGFHAGVLFRPTDTTRIGLNYRSQIVMHLTGDSSFVLYPNIVYTAHNFGFNIPLPAITTLSVYHDMNQQWALMGTLAYDNWSSLRGYNAQNYIQPPTTPGAPGVLVPAYVPQNMSNTLDASIGAHYKVNEQWMLRGSIKLEGAPTQSQYRDINFPDSDKLGFQIGARYTATKALAFDVLYGHVFTPSAHINSVNPVSGASVSGSSRTAIDLVGAQMVWTI